MSQNTNEQLNDVVKNFNANAEIKNAGDFIKKLVRDPIGAITDAAHSDGKKTIVLSAVMMVVWVVFAAIYQLVIFLKALTNAYYKFRIAELFKSALYVITPIVIIGVFVLIILIMNSKQKKSILTLISCIVIAHIPIIVTRFLYIFETLNPAVFRITNVVNGIFYALHYILLFFGMKALFESKSESQESGIARYSGFLMKFLLVIAIYELVGVALRFVGIYI